MRLLLRPETYRVATPDGMYFLTYQGPVTLTGPSIAAWVERLAPHLDGTRTLEELTSRLDPERKSMVDDLVTRLIPAGVVRELAEPSDAAPHTGPEHPQRRLLGYYRGASVEVFARYGAARTVLIGPRWLAGIVAGTCARSGLEDVRVVEPDQPHEPLAELVSQATIVLVLGTGANPEQARDLERWCAGRATVFGQLTVGERESWIGPIGSTADVLARWRSAWRSAPPELAPVDGVNHRAARIAAPQLVQRVFRTATGIADDAERRSVVVLRHDTATSERHTVHPHPSELPCVEPSFPPGDDRLSEETVSRRTAELVDSRFGVFTDLRECRCGHGPLYLSRLTVTDPMGLVGTGQPPPSVLGYGLDITTARLRAALLGYATYGALVVDPRRVLGAEGTDPERALRTGHVRGYRLDDDQPCVVAVPDAFPVLEKHMPGPWPPAGSAAGYSWPEAVGRGLLARCRELAVRRLAEATGRFPGVDLDDVRLDERGERYRGMLRAIGPLPEVYDLTSLTGVATYLFRTADRPVCYAVGMSAPDALRKGMLRVLRHHRALWCADPRCALPGVPDLPAALRGPRGNGDAPSEGFDDALAAILRSGARPVAVPLNHDPVVAERMPFIARVVLHDAR